MKVLNIIIKKYVIIYSKVLSISRSNKPKYGLLIFTLCYSLISIYTTSPTQIIQSLYNLALTAYSSIG
ncbi:MAG: hypothetical protein IT267_07925 [Saprospiraceae bacterium]|nr:hypothetical protein [Saprospiraceae bacterium]